VIAMSGTCPEIPSRRANAISVSSSAMRVEGRQPMRSSEPRLRLRLEIWSLDRRITL
jgi:hypothetical protein